MPGSKEIKTVFAKELHAGGTTVKTNRTNQILIKKMNMQILEMEDVLFHHSSSVMMPDKIAGKSADDGTASLSLVKGSVHKFFSRF